MARSRDGPAGDLVATALYQTALNYGHLNPTGTPTGSGSTPPVLRQTPVGSIRPRSILKRISRTVIVRTKRARHPRGT